jgi:hypothetical protein
MREADAPSTGSFVTELSEVCPPHRGDYGLIVRGPAQRFKGTKLSAAPGTKRTQRGPGQYSGWSPTPSFAAARESYPSRGLLQCCYKSAYRG